MTDHAPVLRDHAYHRIPVKAVVVETNDARSYVLDVPTELRDTYRYRPGQFCTFRVRVDGQELLRSYSMSSAPATDDDLAVTVKRVPGGVVSNWFVDTVRAGDVLELTRPAGIFSPSDTERPLLGFCGGSGITPVMSIIKDVLSETRRAVRLLYANRDRGSVIFDEALAELAAHHPGRLEVRHHSDADGGFLTPDDIAAFMAGDVGADCYLCGPGPFMDLVEAALEGQGVARDRIFIERFLIEQQVQDNAPASAGPGAAPAGVPGEVTVILNAKTTTLAYRAGDTVLETARRGGLRPPFSCEAGNCATCMAFLKEGAVTMRVNNALSAEEVAEGWILTCQSLPSGGAVTVEYEPL